MVQSVWIMFIWQQVRVCSQYFLCSSPSVCELNPMDSLYSFSDLLKLQLSLIQKLTTQDHFLIKIIRYRSVEYEPICDSTELNRLIIIFVRIPAYRRDFCSIQYMI